MNASAGLGSPRSTYSGKDWVSMAVLAVLLMVQTLALHAQVGTANVSGTVQGRTGAMVPGATVTLTDELLSLVPGAS